MALPDNLKLEVGTAFVLGVTGTHVPTNARHNLGAITDLITLTSVADDAARQSDKIDFGEFRPPAFNLSAALEFAATPTAGETVEFWLAYSTSDTAGQANPANVDGADAAYTGYATNIPESKVHMHRIGIFTVTADVTPIIQTSIAFGLFVPRMRYATLIVINKSGAALHSDMVEMSVAFDPVEHKTVD